MFFPNIFMNSEEFKDLGNLHYERRNLDYYPTGGNGEQAKRLADTGTEFFVHMSAGGAAPKKWKQK